MFPAKLSFGKSVITAMFFKVFVHGATSKSDGIVFSLLKTARYDVCALATQLKKKIEKRNVLTVSCCVLGKRKLCA